GGRRGFWGLDTGRWLGGAAAVDAAAGGLEGFSVRFRRGTPWAAWEGAVAVAFRAGGRRARTGGGRSCCPSCGTAPGCWHSTSRNRTAPPTRLAARGSGTGSATSSGTFVTVPRH